MSVEVTLSQHGEPDVVRQFATNIGLAEFGDWVLTLPDEEYPDLRDFINDGWAEDLAGLRQQVRHALDEHPPDTPDVASVAMGLENLIGPEPGDGTIMLGDGGGVEFGEN